MNKTILALGVIAAMGLVGCSTTKQPESDTVKAAADTKIPVKDMTISTEFRDDGIRVSYSMMGDLEKITIYGTAPAWKGNHTVIAELDAMDKLVKFVHGQTTTSDRRIRIVAESIDRAQDATKHRIGQVQAEFDSVELERSAAQAQADEDNMSRRKAERVEKTVVNTVTKITAQGRLTGVRKVGDSVSADGRVYTAIYEWTERDQALSVRLRNMMK